jgi:ABC-type lipoprotein release transport system permease subunit
LAAVWLVFGAEFRRRWRSWLLLVVLVAVVGGLVLSAAVAGRRTATAFPRFVAAHGYDFLLFNFQPLPSLAKLPEVASVTEAASPINGNLVCACTHDINSSYLSIIDLSPTALNRVVKVVTGRMPNQSSPNEVLASFNLEQAYGVHVGTVIHAPFFKTSQLQAIVTGSNVSPAGPTIALHVVGMEAAESEFPVGQGGNTSYDIYTTRAFDRTIAQRAASGTQYFVRLRHGESDLPRFGAHVTSLHALFTQNQDTIATAVTTSIHPQAVGWWVLAVLAVLAGLAVIGQALARQNVVESEEYPTLAALGLPRRRLVVLGTARNLVVAFAGAAGAVVVAFALSPLTPAGEARLAEPSTGFTFDPPILLLGALGTAVVVMVLGAWPALRAARVRMGEDRPPDTHPSSIVAHLAATGAPPSAVIGVRHALERGRGAASVPVGTALFGTVLAVMALCATAVFGASLSHLTATPELYGDAYQVLLANGQSGSGKATAEIARLEHDRAITGIMLGMRAEVSINRVSVFAIAGKAVRGPLLLSTVGGRLPAGNGDIALGTTTLHQVGAHVGSVVHVTVQMPNGGERTPSFHVVGTASFPGQFGLGGLGTGAAFTLAGYLNAICPPGPAQSTCQSAFQANQNFAVMARAIPGPKGQAAINHFFDAYQSGFQGNAVRPSAPTSLVNFGEAVNFPLILGLILALFGAATLVHLLVVSVARRRREIGLLKALGFVNGQVGAAVCWQSTTVGLVGIIVGVPLGVAVGQVVWRAFATNLGAVPVSLVPVWLITALAAGVLVVANVLAIAPAVAAARSKTAGQLLRTQ